MFVRAPSKRTRSQREVRHDERLVVAIDTTEIRLKNIEVDLFDRVAKQAATAIASNRYSNKQSQLCRFYDEISTWESKVLLNPEKFDEYLPFIRMINAKVAYAKGRKQVDDNFVRLINDGLRQVEDLHTLRMFRLFMEAFMGFYKEKRPRD